MPQVEKSIWVVIGTMYILWVLLEWVAYQDHKLAKPSGNLYNS